MFHKIDASCRVRIWFDIDDAHIGANDSHEECVAWNFHRSLLLFSSFSDRTIGNSSRPGKLGRVSPAKCSEGICEEIRSWNWRRERERERKRERIGRSWYRSLREIVRCTTELGTITYKVVSFQDFPLPSLLYLRFSITPTPFDFFRRHPRILLSFLFRITPVYSQHEFRPPALIQMISIGQSTICLSMFSCVQILIDRTPWRFMRRRYIWE